MRNIEDGEHSAKTRRAKGWLFKVSSSTIKQAEEDNVIFESRYLSVHPLPQHLITKFDELHPGRLCTFLLTDAQTKHHSSTSEKSVAVSIPKV